MLLCGGWGWGRIPLDLWGADIRSMFCKSISSLVLSFYDVDLQDQEKGHLAEHSLRWHSPRSSVHDVPQHRCLSRTGNLMASDLQTCLRVVPRLLPAWWWQEQARHSCRQDGVSAELSPAAGGCAGWTSHLPEAGGDRHRATQGSITCFTPLMAQL